MNLKGKAFVDELNALMQRHGVRLVSHDDYDGEENPAGSHCNFEGEDIHIPVSTISSS